jgi:predicted aldo/keto reductase-like oxidoreductase
MRYQHYFAAQGREKRAMEHYASLGNHNATSCIECSGACEEVCPYDVPVQGLLIAAHNMLSIGSF